MDPLDMKIDFTADATEDVVESAEVATEVAPAATAAPVAEAEAEAAGTDEAEAGSVAPPAPTEELTDEEVLDNFLNRVEEMNAEIDGLKATNAQLQAKLDQYSKRMVDIS